MNPSFFVSMLVRWFFLVPVLAALIVALDLATGFTNFVLGFAYGFPASLIYPLGVCLLCSFLVTVKNPLLFKNSLDKYVIAVGSLVMLAHGGLVVYDTLTKKSGQTIPAEFAPFLEKVVVYPKNVLDEWEQGVWRNKTPACLRATESSIENTCPGSIDVTFCWQMDPTKDWGIKGVDCALGMKSKRIFSKGETQFKVPWCRSYESACLATFMVVEAKALKFK